MVLVYFPVRLEFLCVFYLLMGSALAKLRLDKRLLAKLAPALLVFWICALCTDRHSYDMVEMMVFPSPSSASEMLRPSPCESPGFIGDMSYGIYIYHYLIARLVGLWKSPLSHGALGVAVGISLSMVAGGLSFHLIEKHALALKNWCSLEAVANVSVAARNAEEVAIA